MSGQVVHLVKVAGIAGAETHLLSLLPGLRRRGWDVRLLMLHEGDLVAVEVKVRTENDVLQPEEAVNWWQLKRIVHALATYAVQAELLELHWRVDLIAIETDAEGTVKRLDHIPDIFPP